jgi:hypothetical protein
MEITATQAAAKLGRSPRTIRLNCQKHAIGRKVGHFWLLNARELDRLRRLIRAIPGPHPKNNGKKRDS